MHPDINKKQTDIKHTILTTQTRLVKLKKGYN